MAEGTKNVVLEDAEDVAAALSTYIKEVNMLATGMQTAAKECSDNLANDEVSGNAIAALNRDLQAVHNAVEEASDILTRLNAKIEEIKGVVGTSASM